MKVEAKVNRMVIRDEEGHEIKGEPRPYQLEISVGRHRFFTTWLVDTDENSDCIAKETFAAIAAKLKGENLCRTEIETAKRAIPKKTKRKTTGSKKENVETKKGVNAAKSFSLSLT